MNKMSHNIDDKSAVNGRHSLDVVAFCGINIFTLISIHALGASDARQQAIEEGCPHRRGHIQSRPGQGARSEVPRRRVLRSARRRAGQIRDAAPRLCRQAVNHGGSRRVWRLRPSYYQAKANFDTAGIAGLVQAKPGPRGPHKLDDDIMAFLKARLIPGEPVRARELARLVRNELNVELHPRTIERALKKTGR